MIASTLIGRIAEIWSECFLAYSGALALYYVLLLVLGFLETMRLVRGVPWQEARRRMQSPLTPGISVIVAAYNEELSIVESVHSLLGLNYPEFEVVIVNDGSKDKTLELLIEQFDLYKVWRPYVPVIPSKAVRGVYESRRYANLFVVDKENFACKADAANAGINLARHPLIAIIDGDSMLDADSLLRAVRPFVRDPVRTVGVGGTIRVANGCSVHPGGIIGAGIPGGLVARIQIVEYMRSFLFSRMAWSWANGLLIVSGAFGLFDRRAVLDAGGYATNTLGEDMELVVRMHRILLESKADYRMRFVPEPVCWTEVPEKMRDLRNQRMRWHKGLLDVLWRNRKMFGRPSYGAVGMFAMPCYFLFEVLGPVVELSGLVLLPVFWLFGVLNGEAAFWIVLVVGCMGLLFSLLAVLLDDIAFRSYRRTRDLVSLVSAAILENFGYRQITAWWRVRACWEFILGRRSGWGAMERRGLGK